MTKNKNIRRAAAAAKDAIEKAKDEALDVAVDMKDTAVDAVETVTETAGDVQENVTKRVRRSSKKDTRNWLIIAAVIIIAFLGYKYVAQNGVPSVRGLMTGMPAAGAEVDANDEKQWGYAVGAIVGQQVVQMMDQAPGRDEMDMDMFVRGLDDVVRATEKPLLTEEQVQALLEARMQMEQDKMIALAQENLAASDAFVAEYAQKEGVQELEGGTLYTVQTQGTGYRVGDRSAQVHYRGTHINGEEFDSSRADGMDEPVVLSAEMVVPGFAAALSAMRVGDVWEVVIPADQAYGEYGMQMGGIEPNEALIFEIEIVDLDA